MTKLEALKIAHEELSNMMPYGDEDDYICSKNELNNSNMKMS